MPSFLAVTDWMRQPFTQPISFSSQRRLSCNMSLTLILPTYCHRVILMAWRSQGLLNLLRIYASLHFHYQQPISNHHNLNSCNCIHFCPVQPIVYSACKIMYKNTNLIHLFSGLKPVSNFPWLPDSYYVQKTTACFSSPIFLLSISPLPLVSSDSTIHESTCFDFVTSDMLLWSHFIPVSQSRRVNKKHWCPLFLWLFSPLLMRCSFKDYLFTVGHEKVRRVGYYW